MTMENTKVDHSQDDDMQTIFADDVTFNGDLTTDKDVTVYGTYTGTLTCRTLNVATTGSVKGDIDAETIKVSGRMDGKVTANNLMVSKLVVLRASTSACASVLSQVQLLRLLN